MAKLTGLGKGLDALFAENTVDENGYELVNIDDISPNREQPRRAFDEESLAELADSIKQRGILQPLIIQPTALDGYVIIAGERRWRAARMAGLAKVPAIIRRPDAHEAAVIALIENLQREDLNPVETAEGCRRLMDDHGLTQEALAAELGKPRSAIANLLRILALPADVIELVRTDKLSLGHAKALAALPAEAASALASRCAAEGLSVRACEELAKAAGKPAKKSAPKTASRTALIVESEKVLKEKLGRRVTISGSDKKGKLTVDYCGEGDLIDLVNRLSGNGDDRR